MVMRRKKSEWLKWEQTERRIGKKWKDETTRNGKMKRERRGVDNDEGTVAVQSGGNRS